MVASYILTAKFCSILKYLMRVFGLSRLMGRVKFILTLHIQPCTIHDLIMSKCPAGDDNSVAHSD